MEKLFNAIMSRIAEALPELSHIDEDYGQLQPSEDGYPLTFPCVLISTPSVRWETTCTTLQEGQGTLTIKLVIDCYDDTHHGSRTEQLIEERLLMNKRLVSALYFFRTDKRMSPLKRTVSSDYSLGGGIKVYETTFAFNIKETFKFD